MWQHRTERIKVGKSKKLSKLCHNVKNLYNRAMWKVKKKLKEEGKLYSYYDLERELKGEQCYRILPAQTAQQTLKLLIREWKAYFQAVKEYRTDPQKFYAPPKAPRYKSKKGEKVAILTNQQAKIRNGRLILPKKVGYTVLTRLTEMDKIAEVRIIPKGVGYNIEIVYRKHVPKIKKNVNKKRIAAIDLGMVNLVTLVDNIGSRPIVVKDTGKGIKSIHQYYLKRLAKLQRQYSLQAQQKGLKHPVYGPAFKRLNSKWLNKSRDYLHKLSSYIVRLCQLRGITHLVVGYNPTWKQHLRLHRKTTQLFVLLPYDYFLNLLEYKCQEVGISFSRVEEDYTSKCSFLDDEPVQKHQTYLGKRVTRGLYRSSKGIEINADVNAAYNILVLSDPQALPPRSVGGVGGYVVYPLRVTEKDFLHSFSFPTELRSHFATVR